MASITEITVLGGQCYRVEGEAKAVERLILDAARGSIMQFAWFTDTQDRRFARHQSQVCRDAAGCQRLAARRSTGATAGRGDTRLLRAADRGLARLIAGCAAACFLACFLASFSTRRSRSRLSRASFAIVVFFLPVDAIVRRSFPRVLSAAMTSESGGKRLRMRSDRAPEGVQVVLPAAAPWLLSAAAEHSRCRGSCDARRNTSGGRVRALLCCLAGRRR